MRIRMLNEVTVEGYVGRIPKNVSKDGKGPFVTTGIRQDIFYDYRLPDGTTEERKKEFWFSAVCFGKLATQFLVDVKGGERIVLKGSIRPNHYKKGNNDVFSHEIQIKEYRLVAKSGMAEDEADQPAHFDTDVSPESFQDDIAY